ncbi:MAG: YkgJ family cysteine cluster protein [Thermoanaerobaculia bacterium]|nr:YkgJ family cysteine cluster protein [Thermoanaerobaculia bacterium]
MRELWYRDGLSFTCHGCGDCCRGEGWVWVDDAEAAELAEHLGIEVEDFRRSYLRRVGRRWSLVDNDEGDCVFWRDGCSVYQARPGQCRTFPFWPENLRSEGAWGVVCLQCPGAGSGSRYSFADIQRIRGRRDSTARGPDPGSGRGCG